MACRNAYKRPTEENVKTDSERSVFTQKASTSSTKRLLFGSDSKTPANDLLQNNITEFDWVTRNKLYPNFFGRYLVGENCLTKKEMRCSAKIFLSLSTENITLASSF